MKVITKLWYYNKIILTLILVPPNSEARFVKIFCYENFLLELQPLNVNYKMMAEILPYTSTAEGRHA